MNASEAKGGVPSNIRFSQVGNKSEHNHIQDRIKNGYEHVRFSENRIQVGIENGSQQVRLNDMINQSVLVEIVFRG